MRRRNIDFLCAVVIVGCLRGLRLSTTLLLRALEHLPIHYTFDHCWRE